MGKSIMKCDCNVIHNDVVKLYKKGFSSSKLLIEVSEFFHILSDNTRISILSILDGRNVCVSDISSILNMTKSAVSHQLKVLKDAELVKCSKSGKEIYYTLFDDNITEIISLALAHLNKNQ